MNKKKLETVGTVSKKEHLSVADMDNCKILILENTEPFPGYHGLNLPKENKAESLFLVTKSAYNDEKIIRAIQHIKKQNPELTFDGTPGTINLYNSPVGVVRIKDMSYEAVPLLVKLFENEGISFKKKKKLPPYQCTIKIRKFFKMQQVEEGIYRDTDIKEMYYLVIPKALRWNSFEKITMEIKYNMEDNNYDAAMVSVFYEHGILDLVRIYDQKYSIEKLRTIRKKYLEKIN